MRYIFKQLNFYFLFFAVLPCYLFSKPLAYSIAHSSTLVIFAGNSQKVCAAGDSVTLGGSPTASGGTAPYTYSWSPTTGMNNSHIANPRVAILNSSVKFYLAVTDNAGNKALDSVNIYIDSIYYASAGGRQDLCGGKSVKLGDIYNSSSFKYTWMPGDSLSCTICPQPYARPITQITYTMTVTDPSNGCQQTSQVTITPYGANVSTVSPVYLTEGQNINLQASGAVTYEWYPQQAMFNGNTATPEIEPEYNTTYYVAGYDGNGCAGFDSVLVIVKSDTDLVFYNTFTPNGDGINDTWYVGNIFLYPNNDLYIYSRYGKLVYYAHQYVNQWDGKSQDAILPAATYYYVLNTGTGKTYRGAVTIIRIE